MARRGRQPGGHEEGISAPALRQPLDEIEGDRAQRRQAGDGLLVFVLFREIMNFAFVQTAGFLEKDESLRVLEAARCRGFASDVVGDIDEPRRSRQCALWARPASNKKRGRPRRRHSPRVKD